MIHLVFQSDYLPIPSTILFAYKNRKKKRNCF